MSYLAKYQTKKAEVEAAKIAEAMSVKKAEVKKQNLRDIALAEFTEKIKSSASLSQMANYIVSKTLHEFTDELTLSWDFQILTYYDGGDYGYYAECKDPNCDLKPVINEIVIGEGVEYSKQDLQKIQDGKEKIAMSELVSRVETLLASRIKNEFCFSRTFNSYTNTLRIEFQIEERKKRDISIDRFEQAQKNNLIAKIVGVALIAVFVVIVIVTQTNGSSHYSEGWALLGGGVCLVAGIFICCLNFHLG
jgi:hypothetical protein